MAHRGFPKWVEQLVQQVNAAIQYSGLGDTEVRYFPASRTREEYDMLKLAPAQLLFLTDDHPDGEPGWSSIQYVDALDIQRAFDQVRSVTLGPHFTHRDVLCYAVEGIVRGRRIEVEVWLQPFADSEVKDVVDLRTAGTTGREE